MLYVSFVRARRRTRLAQIGHDHCQNQSPPCALLRVFKCCIRLSVSKDRDRAKTQDMNSSVGLCAFFMVQDHRCLCRKEKTGRPKS